jgi:hypothetical protein
LVRDYDREIVIHHSFSGYASIIGSLLRPSSVLGRSVGDGEGQSAIALTLDAFTPHNHGAPPILGCGGFLCRTAIVVSDDSVIIRVWP